MAEKNIKISGIGDVTREDFVRAITDPDKFKEFADQQGWGNKRRQLAWNSLHNYAQGVQNGEINEINDMHQIVDDTGARTNKPEKYNWIGSKFDANGATAAFMNQIAKSMQTSTKSTDKPLKSIPSVTSYLNQQWFGSNNPDWALFQKNDTLTNGVYGIANRSAKIKEGLTKYKNELTTNGAQYNWDGVDKDALYKNLDAAIASSNVATYAPLGITSDYINNALATKDLSAIVVDTDTDDTQTQTQTVDDPTRGFSEEELAQYNTMTPEQQQKYLAQRQQIINLNNEEVLTKNQAKIDAVNKAKEDAAFKNWLKANGYYSPKAQATSYVSSRLVQTSLVDSKGKRIQGPAVMNGEAFDRDHEKYKFQDSEWDSFIHGDLTSDTHKVWALKNADRHTTNGDVAIRSKLDWINYNYQWLLDTGKLNLIGDDVSSYVDAPIGTVWRLKNSKRSSDGTYMYMRKRGNKLEFYRSKSWNDLRNNEYKKHISKHQWGGVFGDQSKLREQYSKDLKARQDAIKKQKIQSQPQQAPFGRSSVKSMGKNTNTLTTADKIAIGAAATDFLASFTANPIANGVGTVLTTGADIASDISHGASFGQAAGNAAMNLGMGLIGFIPGLGTATKAKKLKKILQVSSGAVQAYFIANNFKEGVKSLSKVLDGSATVQDYKNLIYGLQGAKGASNSIINTAKRRGAAKAIKELPDKFNAGKARYTFKYKGKETQRLTQAQVKELQEKGSEGVSDDIKQLLNGVVVKPSKTIETKLGFSWTKKQNPIEYQYKPKGEIQKLLDDLQIQSQKSSMWNPGRQDYLSMTSEHNWSLPSISIGLGKNSVKEVVKRGKQSPKPNITPESQPIITNNPEKPLQTHNITPEQQKRDIELLRKRFTSDKPLPIDNATRKAYEDYRKRPMTDQEIIELEKEQRAKRSKRSIPLVTQEDNYAARRIALQKRKALAKDIENAQQEIKQAKANTQVKINIAEGNARAKDLPVPSARVIVTPESVRAQANREFALNWKPIEFKPELKGAARSKKQAMYERLFPPFAERQGTGRPVQHTTRKSLERLQKMQDAVQQEFLERQRKQNAIILSPTESRQGMYQQMFSPVLTNLDNQARAMGLRAKPSKADVKSTKSSEYKQQQKQSRQQKASEVMEAFGNTKSNNTKGHNKNTNLPHKQSNKKKKTSRDTNIKRRQDGGVLYDYEFLKSVHAFKQGGVIKAQGGIKTGVKVNPKTTWFDAVWSQNINHILRGLSDNKYYIWLNSMQDKHGDLYKNAGPNFQITPYNDKSVGDYQNLYKTGYNDEWKDNNIGYNSLGIMHAQNLGRYDLYGNTKRTSGDWNIDANNRYKTDSSYSQITDDRRLLGRKGDFTDEQLASITEAFKSKGYNFTLGKNDYYYLSPIEKSEQNQNTPKKDGSVTNPDIGKKSIFDKGKEYLAKLTSNPGNLYNAVETGKYLLANKATNDIAKIKMPNFVISPKHTSYQVMDNLAQQNAYHSKAAETMNQTSRPLTSSGQLQTAAQQESMNNANKLYLQGNAERNTWLEGQKQQSYKAGLYNMESAVDTANANAKQAWIVKSKNDYEDARGRLIGLATNRQNWINALEKFNIIDPYVERKNAQQQYGLAKAQWDYQNDANVLAAQQKYQQLLRQHWNDLNFNVYDTDEYRNLINAQKKAGARYYNNMYQVYGISNPGFKYSTPLFQKKGGKFEDISKFNTKEFYNTIRHSINTATKQGGDLSKLINTLFKKSNKK